MQNHTGPGEYYVPVRQTEAVVRLLYRLLLIFWAYIKVLYILIGKNRFLLNIFNPGLYNGLKHHLSTVLTCTQFLAVLCSLEAAMKAA